MFVLLFCAAIVSGILWLIYSHKNFVNRRKKYLQNVPGPKPNPIFGNMLEFAGPSHKILGTMKKFLENHGPICHIYLGPLSDAVLVSDERFIEFILSSNKIIDKASQYEYLHSWLGTGLLTSTGQKWKQRRRMITPSFHFSILDNFVDVFNDVGEIFIQKLGEHVGEENFNIYPMVSLCTLDIICQAAMGVSVNAQTDGNSEYVRNVKEMCRILTDRNFSPLDPSLYPLTINYYKELKVIKVLHDHTDSVINRKIEEVKKSEEKNHNYVDDDGVKRKFAFLDLLLKSNINGKPLSKADIREEVDTFMFEGHDTTSSAISFALYLLANHPLVQAKVYQEQKEIFGNLHNVKNTINDLQNMKYLDVVVKETLRIYPSVPFYGRQVTEDFVWEDIAFPKGINIVVFPYVSQRNPEYFPSPLEFIPERFLDVDGKNPYRYVPFSAGPRNCIGQKFAMLEIKSTVSQVIRNFELSPAKDNQSMLLAPEIILVSKNGIRLSLKKRV
ncbi:cytochrome P450 4C1-like [Diabrotica undecimpunctata]|uniref:cytochrome P450 4C1-like n=1 Tax=Diabrotica undecimpunctata TaxID=50387 RepID=UPI003B640007